MMRHHRLLKIFLVIAFLQLAFPLYSIYTHEMALAYGESYKFKIVPVDPADPFRGRYLDYAIDMSRIDTTLDHNSQLDTVYIGIATDSEGYAYLDAVYETPPAGKAYVKAMKSYGRYITPFSKYYLNENIAYQAEVLYRQQNEDATVHLKVRNGISVVEGLYIGDRLVDKLFE